MPYTVRVRGLTVKYAAIAGSSKYGVTTILSPFTPEVSAPRAYRAFGFAGSSVDSVSPDGIVTESGRPSV